MKVDMIKYVGRRFVVIAFGLVVVEQTGGGEDGYSLVRFVEREVEQWGIRVYNGIMLHKGSEKHIRKVWDKIVKESGWKLYKTIE